MGFALPSSRDSNLPWCVIGDLNNVVSRDDKDGGDPYPNSFIEGFNQAIYEAGLVDMAIVGHQFSWERGRDTSNFIEVRLDRALMNNTWLSKFPMPKLYNLEGSISYHNPILLVPQIFNQTNYAYRFKFENAWMIEPMFE